MALEIGRLTVEVRKLIVQHSTIEYEFSKPPKSGVMAILLNKRDILEMGFVLIDTGLTHFLPAAAIMPHVWMNSAETREAPALLKKLTEWVEADGPVQCTFLDVQPYATGGPLKFVEDGVGAFSGVPDAVSMRPEQIEAVLDAFAAAQVSVDWKTSAAMNEEPKVLKIALVQVIALAEKHGGKSSPPVMMTDMMRGFRVWMMFEGRIFQFHRVGNFLSLAHGVALIRLFAASCGHVPESIASILRAVATPSVRVATARGGGGGGGGSSGGGGGAGSTGGGGGGPKGDESDADEEGRGGRGGEDSREDDVLRRASGGAKQRSTQFGGHGVENTSCRHEDAAFLDLDMTTISNELMRGGGIRLDI